ncbi:MAG TPA: hypothetical protein VGL89_03395 [Candidatus Koribacter sp.]|jgi:hypothetical protein
MRATIAVLGKKKYQSSQERWWAFTEWIRTDLRIKRDCAGGLDGKSKHTRHVVRALKRKEAAAQETRRSEKARNPTDEVLEKMIRKVADAHGSNLSEMEMKRGVRMVKDRDRKGAFHFYALDDLLQNEMKFIPMLESFLIRHNVVVHRIVAQSKRAAQNPRGANDPRPTQRGARNR